MLFSFETLGPPCSVFVLLLTTISDFRFLSFFFPSVPHGGTCPLSYSLKKEVGVPSKVPIILSNNTDGRYRYSLLLAKNDKAPPSCDGSPLSQKVELGKFEPIILQSDLSAA